MSEHAATKLHPPEIIELPVTDDMGRPLDGLDGLDDTVIGNGTWEVGYADEHVADPSPDHLLPAEEAKSSYDDVMAAIDVVREARHEYESTPIKRREYRAGIQDTVDDINNRSGIDNLAFTAVGKSELRKRLRKGPLEGPAPVDNPELLTERDSDLEEYELHGEDLAAIRDMVKLLPKDSRAFYRETKKKYEKTFDVDEEYYSRDEEDDLDDDEEDDVPDEEARILALANEPTGIPQKRSRLKELVGKGKEALRTRRTAKVLGLVALAGVGYAVAKGIISPDHVTPHVQLVADTHNVVSDPHGAAAHAPVSRPYGFVPSGTYGEDRVSKAEVFGWDTLQDGVIAAIGIHMYKKRKEKREHHEHLEREHAHERAETLSIKTLLDPESPQAEALVDALKSPRLLDEIRDHGDGPSGSLYAGDALIRFARTMSSQVGGNAEGITRLFRDLRIDTGSTVFEDVPTRGGGTTINVTNRNPREVTAIVEQLTQGSLRLGDLPPTDAFLGDPVIDEEFDYLYGHDVGDDARTIGLADLMQWAPPHQYTGLAGPTADQIQDSIARHVNVILDRLADNLPNGARQRVLEALRLQEMIRTYDELQPDGSINTRYRLRRVNSGAVEAGRRTYDLAT